MGYTHPVSQLGNLCKLSTPIIALKIGIAPESSFALIIGGSA
jgi:hypothetical protein